MLDILQKSGYNNRAVKKNTLHRKEQDIVEKNVEVSLLLDFYGTLLREKHRTAVDLYCNSDLSLSETAEELSITRQGARDLIKRAEAALYEYEEKLGLYKRYRENTRLVELLNDRLTAAEGLCDEELRAEIGRIKDITKQFIL